MHFQYMRKSWAWFQHFCQFCFKGWMGVSEVQCNALIMWLWAWLKTMNCIIYYINVKDANDILPYLAPVNVVPQEAPKICQRKFCDRILPGLHHLCQNPYCQCYIYVIFNVRILCVYKHWGSRVHWMDQEYHRLPGVGGEGGLMELHWLVHYSDMAMSQKCKQLVLRWCLKFIPIIISYGDILKGLKILLFSSFL